MTPGTHAAFTQGARVASPPGAVGMGVAVCTRARGPAHPRLQPLYLRSQSELGHWSPGGRPGITAPPSGSADLRSGPVREEGGDPGHRVGCPLRVCRLGDSAALTGAEAQGMMAARESSLRSPRGCQVGDRPEVMGPARRTPTAAAPALGFRSGGPGGRAEEEQGGHEQTDPTEPPARRGGVMTPGPAGPQDTLRLGLHYPHGEPRSPTAAGSVPTA